MIKLEIEQKARAQARLIYKNRKARGGSDGISLGRLSQFHIESFVQGASWLVDELQKEKSNDSSHRK